MTKPHPIRAAAWLLALGVVLVACAAADLPGADRDAAPVSSTIPAGRLLAGELVRGGNPASDAAAGICWGAETIPAVIETVTEQAEVTPAQLNPDGTVRMPATFQTSTRQRIVTDRQDVWFRTPCPDLIDAAFVETLQRALKVRGLYRGTVTGVIDAATAGAIRRFQAPQGLDSSTLSLLAARQLGLVALDREALN